MITEKDLQEAIAECQGQRNPNANTCIKLAAFYILKRELFSESEKGVSIEMPKPQYSYSYKSESEFSEAIRDLDFVEDVMPIMDELMNTLQIVNPRLYAAVLRKIKERE